jgi:hypothetical protein
MKKANKIDALKKLKAFIREIIRRKDIEVNIPRDRGHYLWLRGTKSPRIKFINEHLKRLEKK